MIASHFYWFLLSSRERGFLPRPGWMAASTPGFFQSPVSPFPFLWTFQLNHLWKSPPFPSSNPHPLKSSHSPLAVGPPIAAQQQESPSTRGGRGHGAQHAGKPCRVLLLHFLPRSPREHRRRPPARLCAARPGSASLPFLPEAETRVGRTCAPLRSPRRGAGGCFARKIYRPGERQWGDPNGRGLRHFKRLFSGKHPAPPCAL